MFYPPFVAKETALSICKINASCLGLLDGGGGCLGLSGGSGHGEDRKTTTMEHKAIVSLTRPQKFVVMCQGGELHFHMVPTAKEPPPLHGVVAESLRDE